MLICRARCSLLNSSILSVILCNPQAFIWFLRWTRTSTSSTTLINEFTSIMLDNLRAIRYCPSGSNIFTYCIITEMIVRSTLTTKSSYIITCAHQTSHSSTTIQCCIKKLEPCIKSTKFTSIFAQLVQSFQNDLLTLGQIHVTQKCKDFAHKLSCLYRRWHQWQYDMINAFWMWNNFTSTPLSNDISTHTPFHHLKCSYSVVDQWLETFQYLSFHLQIFLCPI